MNTRNLILSAAALLALCAPGALAQSQTNTTASGTTTTGSTATSTSTDAKPATVGQRKENQQDRIAQGVKSGQLTAGETKNLETKETGINKETRTMRSEDDDHLTAADRAKLNRQQNRVSNSIYQDKHNANQAHYGNGKLGQRRENQQDRIAQGVKSGQLTAGEAAKTERQQRSINREASNMRQANGGKLTNGDKQALNQRQNRASRHIYAKKHNAKRQ